MTRLEQKECLPCSGDTPPLTGEEIAELKPQLDADWSVVEEHHLQRHYRFNDFARALAFVNRVGEIAEGEGHHPDIYFTWGKAELKIFTHAIDGLSEADFILAAKIDRITGARPEG